MLRRVPAGTGAVVAFAYDAAWLARPEAFVIDPTHGRYAGDQFPRTGELAGVFSDTAPDRWGRSLLERQEAVRARDEGRRRRTLGEWEFLLGVSDFSRMGALRFVTADGRYLDDEPRRATDGRPAGAEAAARELEQPSRGGRSAEAGRLALLLPRAARSAVRVPRQFEDADGAVAGQVPVTHRPS